MAAIRLDGVSLSAGGRPVLREMQLKIPQGQLVGLLGPNGAGKTTLLRALLGERRPDCGEITIFGAQPRPGQAGVGYLPQSQALAQMPVAGMDLLAISGATGWGLPLAGPALRADIAWALAQTEAEGFAHRRLAALSGGERQRILIAQALLGRPRLLLLDEPLAGLDPRHQAELVALLAGLRTRLGLTILCAAHELEVLLPAVDQVLYTGAGRAVLGHPDAVVQSEVLSTLYGGPVEVVRAAGRVFVVPGVAGDPPRAAAP